MAQKPSIPKGTRDFSPLEMMRRQYIFDKIRDVFRTFGFGPLETSPPCWANTATKATNCFSKSSIRGITPPD